jgi:hypothetical protein
VRPEFAGVLLGRTAQLPSAAPAHINDLSHPITVITGLDPVIHLVFVDDRDKPGDDE